MPATNLSCRARLFALCLSLSFLLTASLTAQDRLSPATLFAWHAAGAAPITDPATGAITVPVGGQLDRTYPDAKVTVRLLSRPYFQAKPSNWPGLEVGPAALAFVQDGAGGGMVLLGDEVLTLPQAIALDATGRSIRQLDLSLAFDRSRNKATLVLDGASYNVAATAIDQAVTVAISAGGEAAWTLDLLEVNSSPSAVESDPKTAGTNGDNQPKAGDARPGSSAADVAARKQAFEEALALFKAKDYARAEARLLLSNRQKPGTLGWHLESAGKLTHMALVLRQQYDPHGAIIVAQRAQALLADAGKFTGQADRIRQRAEVHEMKGYLNEELMRDPAAARIDYEQARKTDPGSARATTALGRIEEADAKAIRRGGKP